MKDVTDYVVKSKEYGGAFIMDGIDVETDETVAETGDKVKFKHKGTWYRAVVGEYFEAGARGVPYYFLKLI